MPTSRTANARIDAKNPRTATRHLPAGKLSATTVWAFLFANALAFLGSTAIFYLREPSNPWPLMLAVPVLAFVAGYSLAKRFTALAHVWLGVALMLAPIAAWIAVRGLIEMAVPIVLGSAVLFWVTGFDILYACQDADFDAKEGLHSIPARYGVRRSLRIAAVCHAVMFGKLVLLAFASVHLGTIYLVGLIPIGILLIYEHYLVKPDDLNRVNRAFFQVNGIISMGLLLLVLLQVLVK